jgi:hypothetical protein
VNPDWSRRRFIGSGGTLSGAAWLKLTTPGLVAAAASACDAKESASAFVNLSEAQARELSAISARLIPTTSTPGAIEAGVIHFIDQSLAGEMAAERAAAFQGLSEFLNGLNPEQPNRLFSELDAADQDAYLTDQEGTDFFEFMRLMTIYGFFAMSSHGGNRDHLSWTLIGFEGHGAWTPPFGHYDSETGV